MVDVQARTDRPPRIAELEHGLTAQCIRNVLIAVPDGIAVWVGIVAACISFSTAGYAGPLWMAAGFVSYGPSFDDETRQPRS